MLWLSLSHPPSHLRAASHSLPRSPHLASLDQVVFKQSVQLRRSVQSARGRPLPGPGAASGTLDDATLRRLQHAFVALAGGVATTAQVRVCVCVCVCGRGSVPSTLHQRGGVCGRLEQEVAPASKPPQCDQSSSEVVKSVIEGA